MRYAKSMRKQIISIVLGVSLSTSAFGDCKPVTPLEKGEPAPCMGYLFTPEKELELRIKNEEYKLLMEQTKLYIQQNELYKKELETTEVIVNKERQKAELWRTTAESATEKYVKLEEGRTTRDWVFLVSGVVLTVASGWAIGQASK